MCDSRQPTEGADSAPEHLWGPEGCNGIRCPEPPNPNMRYHVTSQADSSPQEEYAEAQRAYDAAYLRRQEAASALEAWQAWNGKEAG